ncbi:MAG: PEGA domain-containing protein [Polyangiaceae bacterium]|nr:PEGA domain-containing protein [Polyangiaceae bacterium]
MRRGRAASAALLAAALVLGAGRVGADEAADARRARSQFQRALELSKAGDCAQAIQLFREVGQFRMTPQVRFQIASCEERLGHLVAALGGYELALTEAGSVAGDDFVGEVERRAHELKERVPRLVFVRGAGAEAATVKLNGTSLGETSLAAPIPVDPGPHSVEASAPGRRPFSVTVRAAERETVEVKIVLERALEAPAGDARAPRGAAPAAARDEAVGGGPPPLAWVAAGVGAVALVGAGATWALRQDRKAELDAACGPDRQQCPPSARGTYDDAKLYDTLSPVLLGVGVVGIGAAAALWWLRDDAGAPGPGERVAAEPVVAPGWAGLVVHGRF